ncbi:MAG: glycosyltransferase [Rhodospirillales bacterium]|nr:glycosyltransferase [Rhodospirillales bacterium]
MSLPAPSTASAELRICLLHRGAAPFPDAWAELHAVAAEAGHEVTLARCDESGIERLDPGRPDGAAHRITPIEPDRLAGSRSARAAYQAYLWLAQERFDLVCASARAAPLFYALLARSQGLDLPATATLIWVDGLTLLDRARAEEMPHGIDDLADDEMERQSLALADCVIFLDSATQAWVTQRAWATQAATLPLADAGSLRAILDAAAQRQRNRPPAAADANDHPLVTVCVPHFNRIRLLRQAIESVQRQDYPNLELVVVDDASDDPTTVQGLDAMAASLAACGGRLVRHATNQYLGAARNTAVRHARGEYVLFLDDDDYAKPDQVSTLVRVARHTGADIVTSLFDRLPGDEPPTPDQPVLDRWLPLGNAPSLGVFTNLFGPATALIRTSAFASLGGFSTARGIGSEDWELFARATLSGMTLQLVPRALFWYRVTPGSMMQTASGYAGNLRGLAPYLSRVPEPLRLPLCFTQAAGQQLAEAHCRIAEMEKLLATCFEQIAGLQQHIVAQDTELAAAHTHIGHLHAEVEGAHAHLRAWQAEFERAQFVSQDPPEGAAAAPSAPATRAATTAASGEGPSSALHPPQAGAPQPQDRRDRAADAGTLLTWVRRLFRRNA